MSSARMTQASFVIITLLSVTGSGCVSPSFGPGIPIPIPLTPWLQDEEEEQFWEQERYKRVPIMEPLSQGGPAAALDPPSDDEVIRALEKARPVEKGIPFLWTRQRNDIRIVKEKIADYVDPPRVYPTIGPAQLHHAHYKCTIYFEEITRNGWPLPYTTRDDSVEVIYIDHNHFHRVGPETEY